jgi:hypothetical protein
VQVPNITGTVPLAYSVYSDLECLSGPASFSASRGDTYKLAVTPLVAGSQWGSISFVTEDGQYCWYSLEVRLAGMLLLLDWMLAGPACLLHLITRLKIRQSLHLVLPIHATGVHSLAEPEHASCCTHTHQAYAMPADAAVAAAAAGGGRCVPLSLQTWAVSV